MNALSQPISSAETGFTTGLLVSGVPSPSTGTYVFAYTFGGVGGLEHYNFGTASFLPLALTGSDISLSPGGVVACKIDNSSTATHTRMLLWDVDKGTLSRVTVGANDSGGAGFKVLRVPN